MMKKKLKKEVKKKLSRKIVFKNDKVPGKN